MAPHGAGTQLRKISDFTQNQPSDGKPPTQRTDAYLAYDDTNLYMVFVCWDNNPHGVRGHMTRREPSQPFDNDDYIEITLDTFRDQRHGFVFDINPMGVQADALWTEGQGTDYSWDTLWYSRSNISDKGYVLWISIPFRSLRFHGSAEKQWGVTLSRYIARDDETDYWPWVSAKASGRLNQEATIVGFDNVSPGRNMQFIPYAEGRSFRALDTRDPIQPRYSSAEFQGKVGLDSKFVFHDSLVLDTTINPDFAQVESDEPQNTINQRFEVYFPEKRPFFLENSNFFEAPLIGNVQSLRMVFTRRIADPTFGVRLTGKQGPWNLGFLVADDRSPGKIVPPGDPDFGKRAYFAIGRVSHDLGKNSSVAAMFTNREFQNDFNRVGGLDGLLYINKNWNATYRGYMSSTRDPNGYVFGQFHEAILQGNGLRFSYTLDYTDITPGFRTETGFVPRVDQRALYQYGHFYFRTEGKHLIFHGPEENATQLWDHTNTTLQQVFSFDYVFYLHGNIVIAPIVAYESDVLRPSDFPGLPRNHQYVQDAGGLVFRGSPNRLLNWNFRLIRDGTVVVVPPKGQLPYTGNETFISTTLGLKPTGRLQIDNTYILERVVNGAVNHGVVNSNIIRSKWNYQFNKEFSLRFITQYSGALTNPSYSSLPTTKNMNFDVLFTYLLHPGTAVYVGYNSNLENIDPGLCIRIAGALQCDPNGNGLLRSPSGLINDGRQLFVKVSYLFRR
jgi:Domain of unknown function (DUF5916)